MAKETKHNRPYETSKKFFDISTSQILSSDSYLRNNFVGGTNIYYSAMQEGMDWFLIGKTIEEAENLDEYNELYQKFKDKIFKDSFIKGYNIAKRKEMISKIERQDGAKFYNEGGLLELLTEEQKKKMLTDSFMLGYEEAMVASWKNNQEDSRKNR